MPRTAPPCARGWTRRWTATPPAPGDAVVAALAAGLDGGRPRDVVIRDAVAWSAAAVLQPVAGVVDPTDVSRLAAQTLVEDVR